MRLRSSRSAESVGNLIAVVLEDQECHFMSSCVRLYRISWFSHIRVDTDYIDSTRFVIPREFFHALVVGVGDRALDGYENQHSAVLSLQRTKGMLLPVGVGKCEIYNW